MCSAAGRSGGSPEHDGLICKGSSEIGPTQLKRKNKNNPSTKQSNQLEMNYCSQFQRDEPSTRCAAEVGAEAAPGPARGAVPSPSPEQDLCPVPGAGAVCGDVHIHRLPGRHLQETGAVKAQASATARASSLEEAFLPCPLLPLVPLETSGWNWDLCFRSEVPTCSQHPRLAALWLLG